MPDPEPPAPLGDARSDALGDARARPTEDARPGEAQRDAPASPPEPASAPPARRLGDPTDERPIPRGCNPLVFGVVLATIQFGCTVYFMRTC